MAKITWSGFWGEHLNRTCISVLVNLAIFIKEFKTISQIIVTSKEVRTL